MVQHCAQHCAQLESCTVSTIEIVARNVACNCSRSRIGSYFWNVRTTVSLCVHHQQHRVQLRDTVCDFRPMNFHLYYWSEWTSVNNNALLVEEEIALINVYKIPLNAPFSCLLATHSLTQTRRFLVFCGVFFIQAQQKDNCGSFLFCGYRRHDCFGCKKTCVCKVVWHVASEVVHNVAGCGYPGPKSCTMMHCVSLVGTLQANTVFFPSHAPLLPVSVVYRNSASKFCTPTLRGQGDRICPFPTNVSDTEGNI